MKHTHLSVYAIIKRNNKFLLIKKARGPYTNMFDLPGGKIEFGETPEQALVREVMEETSLQVKAHSLAFCDSICFQHTATADNSAEELHHIGIVFDVETEGYSNMKIDADGLDSNGAFWFDPTVDDTENLTPFAKIAVWRNAK